MNKTIAFVSLGCDKNTVDSEIMLQLLTDHGYTLIKEEEKAKILVVNTCAFIQDAKEESINTIIELGEYKKTGACRGLIVTGCLAQRYAKEIFEELPEVDAVVGTGSYEEIVQVADRVLEGGGEKLSCLRSPDERALTYQKRIVSTVGYYEYLKIAEGCDHHCTYCIIPKLRGRYRSRPMEELLKEAQDLADSGVKELIVIAQDTSRYGIDLYGERKLAELLQKLCAIDGFVWVRVHYLYPDEMSEELIDVLANEPKIVKYLDIPIQHINDDILRAMNRRGNGEYVKQLLKKLRARIPGLVIRTSLITGLPGEGEEEFQQLCEFLKEFKLERAGTFAFSPEEGTKAALMEYPDKEVAQERAEIIGELQSRIMDEYNASCEGKIMQVLCDGYDRDEDCYYGRTYADSPDIDGRIWFTSSRHVKTGEFVNVCVVGAYDGELTGMLEEDMEDNDDGE
mgnify:CR=1 FL=1